MKQLTHFDRVAFSSIVLACHLALSSYGALRTVKIRESGRTIAEAVPICRAIIQGAIVQAQLECRGRNIKVDQAARIDTRDTGRED